MSKTRIADLAAFGQSIWLDSISRSMIKTGKLQEMIDQGLRGMTSNPTIFDKAISSGSDYEEDINKLHRSGSSTFEIYDDLTVRDVQDAADLFKPVYEKTGGLDGYVSLEVNPKLAFQTQETISEAKRLHKKVSRPNVMFKVPSTEAGFPAIEELISEGINVNITLIFSLEQYIKTAEAYLKGLKRLHDSHGDLSKIASVASVFVSRIDTAVDKLLDEKISKEQNEDIKNKLGSLRGRTAVANSRLIFKKYLEIFLGEDYMQLQKKGGAVQRVLWGSTGTKDPGYSDIKYVTELIGKPTVNTLPESTLAAFSDHGIVEESLTSSMEEAEDTINALRGFDIDIDVVCAKLLNEGLVSFEKSFDSLLNAIETKSR
jgi:transaldolase